MFSFSSISRDYIFVQALCRIFADRLARIESPISFSVNPVVQLHFIYLMSQSGLLLLIFISLRNILIPFTPGHSGLVVQLFQCSSHYPLRITQQFCKLTWKFAAINNDYLHKIPPGKQSRQVATFWPAEREGSSTFNRRSWWTVFSSTHWIATPLSEIPWRSKLTVVTLYGSVKCVTRCR
jgi:hypothetical protein